MPDEPRVDLTLPARMENLDRFIEAVAGQTAGHGFEEHEGMKIALAVEEAIVNVIHYAYPDVQGEVAMSCTFSPDQGLIVEIKDQGRPFDVLSVPEPELDASVSQREIGGLGVFLFRKIASDVRYERIDDSNVLTLIFALKK